MIAYCYDNNGYFTEVKTVENLEKNQTNIPILDGCCKPRFVVNKWIEGATQEEIEKELTKNSKTLKITIQEKLNAQLLQANAQQQIINASLLKQIAELKGGN